MMFPFRMPMSASPRNLFSVKISSSSTASILPSYSYSSYVDGDHEGHHLQRQLDHRLPVDAEEELLAEEPSHAHLSRISLKRIMIPLPMKDLMLCELFKMAIAECSRYLMKRPSSSSWWFRENLSRGLVRPTW